MSDFEREVTENSRAEADGVEVVAYRLLDAEASAERGHDVFVFFDDSEFKASAEAEMVKRTLEPLVRQSDHLAALSAVTAERDQLRALANSNARQVQHWRDQCGQEMRETLLANAANINAERDTNAMLTDALERAEAQVEALRKDAERYRWLRTRWGRIADEYDGDSDQLVAIREADSHFEGWGVDPLSLDRAIDAALAAAPAPESVSPWISVEDRLPEARDGTRYLVARDCGNGTLKSTSVGFLLGGEWHISDDVRSFRDMGYRVTHWMPLPSAPSRRPRSKTNE